MNLNAMTIEQIEALMDSMPVDVSFVDFDDTVKYFNTPKEGRIFPRTRMDLGRKVQNCHPPKSQHIVNQILDDFRAGKRNDADFWINLSGRMVLIRYYPVRDRDGKYLGTMEVTQDITEIQKLTGEKRLLG